MSNPIALERVLSVWWAFTWRAALTGMLAGGAVGFIVGFVLGATGNLQMVLPLSYLGGWLATIPCSIWSMGVALKKRYGEFSLTLVEHETSPISPERSGAGPGRMASQGDDAQVPADKSPNRSDDNFRTIAVLAGAGAVVGILFVVWMGVKAPTETGSQAVADQTVQPPRSEQFDRGGGQSTSICDPMPAENRSSVAAVLAAFAEGKGDPQRTLAAVSDIENACLTRQAYLAAQRGGDPSILAPQAVVNCKDVSDAIDVVQRKLMGASFQRGTPLGYKTPVEMERDKIEEGRIGKCWSH